MTYFMNVKFCLPRKPTQVLSPVRKVKKPRAS